MLSFLGGGNRAVSPPAGASESPEVALFLLALSFFSSSSGFSSSAGFRGGLNSTTRLPDLFFGAGKEKPDLDFTGGKLLNNDEEEAFGTSSCWGFKEGEGEDKYELLFLGGGRAVKIEEEEEELDSPLGRNELLFLGGGRAVKIEEAEEELYSPLGRDELLFLAGGRAVKIEGEEEEFDSRLGRGGGNENRDALWLGLTSVPFSSSSESEADA